MSESFKFCRDVMSEKDETRLTKKGLVSLCFDTLQPRKLILTKKKK